MNGKEKMIAFLGVLGLFLGGLAIFGIVQSQKIQAEVSLKAQETQAKINAQTQVEKTKLEEAAATQRTQERMNLIPWYKGGENKKQ